MAPTRTDMSQSEGFVEPPPSDRELSVEIVRDVLREQFPQLALQSVEYLASGWRNDAYLVDHHLVVRFPQYAAAAQGLEAQARQLALVASAAGGTFGVPTITLWGEPSSRFPHRFAGHELVPGVPVYDPRAPNAPELADDLGRALARVHSIPAALAGSIGVGARAIDYAKPLHELREWLPRVPQLEDLAPDAWAWFDAGPAVPRDYSGPPRFIHDVSPHHVMVDLDTGRLSGLIDCEARLGDPADDFGELVLVHGPSFLRRALQSYALPVDPELVERATFLGRVRALAWLAGAVKCGEGAGMLETVGRAFTD